MFILLGLLIATLVVFTVWREVAAQSTTGWTYVGTATQFQSPGATNATIGKPAVEVRVYACKQRVGGESGAGSTYRLKARANISSNTTESPYGDPRLEIISQPPDSERYAVSSSIPSTAPAGTTVSTPYTPEALSGASTVYYVFNNTYQNQSGGMSLYAFGTVSRLVDCSFVLKP